jgi:hypothetical protein
LWLLWLHLASSPSAVIACLVVAPPRGSLVADEAQHSMFSRPREVPCLRVFKW